MELVTLENSDASLMVHDAGACHGEVCTIHNRTDHHMRSWPQHWRGDRIIMERICPHGIGHPDPDDYMIIKGYDDGVHGCDGCCSIKGDEVAERVIVNGVEYVEEEIDGKKVLVKKEDSRKINLELTLVQAELIYTLLAVIGGGSDFELAYSDIVWFSDFLMTFTDEATRQAAELVRNEAWEPLCEDSDYFDRYITTLEGKK